MTAIIVLGLRILLAGALYIFLGWALITLWQELKQQGDSLASQKKPGIHIDVRLDNGKEDTYHFRQSEIAIGRNANCDISVIDEAISAHHARLSYHHAQWWLEDLSSTNGTFLNKDQVYVPTVIISGDEFRCGNTLFTIRIDTAEDKPSP
jgi:pSer/pThr/pTyr-binding forkhead associated (FHA) protein